MQASRKSSSHLHLPAILRSFMNGCIMAASVFVPGLHSNHQITLSMVTRHVQKLSVAHSHSLIRTEREKKVKGKKRQKIRNTCEKGW